MGILNIENKDVRRLLFSGQIGLEKEALRVLPDGSLSHTPHPFCGDPVIDRDFCENQLEINTPLFPDAETALGALRKYGAAAEEKLSALPVPELIWPFSNPPLIRSEADIPIAHFEGKDYHKRAYREHLASRYGRRRMTFCGIHVNYSFSEKLLRASHRPDRDGNFFDYKNRFYLSLTEKATLCGWIITALTAASPLVDASFFADPAVEDDTQATGIGQADSAADMRESGLTPGRDACGFASRSGRTHFCGMASLRCSEYGYWNFFTPLLDFRNIQTHASSIERYVDKGAISAPSEFYYPVRLKPKIKNSLAGLREGGADHIELRMVDLNPLDRAGLRIEDLKFIQLFLLWLSCAPMPSMTLVDQLHAAQNFKNAAHYDLENARIFLTDGKSSTVKAAGLDMVERMRRFYADFSPETAIDACSDGVSAPAASTDASGAAGNGKAAGAGRAAGGSMSAADIDRILDFESEKLTDPRLRYAHIIRERFGDDFLGEGLSLARQRAAAAIRRSGLR